jgi:CheY-like chemotaxis protein
MRGCPTQRLTIALQRSDTPGADVELTVSDTGRGIDAATLERIFEPFFTTKPKDEGTGIGLSVVHGAVAAHGGTVTVSSEVGHGAMFRVTLPLGAAAPTVQVADAEEPVPPPAGGRVLLVEDEPAIQRVASTILRRAGYTVHVSSNGAEALQAFANARGAFDVVVTDVTMPVTTGDKLAKALRDLNPRLPVILMTGYSDEATRAQVESIGIIDILEKPFEPPDLVRAVHRALAPEPRVPRMRLA